MAQYTGKTPFTLPRPLVYKNGVNVETINAHKTLTYFDSQYQILEDSTASATREIILPSPKNGAWFCIRNESNGGTSNFNVQGVGGATIVALPKDKSAFIVCDGTQWHLAVKGD